MNRDILKLTNKILKCNYIRMVEETSRDHNFYIRSDTAHIHIPVDFGLEASDYLGLFHEVGHRIFGDAKKYHKNIVSADDVLRMERRAWKFAIRVLKGCGIDVKQFAPFIKAAYGTYLMMRGHQAKRRKHAPTTY